MNAMITSVVAKLVKIYVVVCIIHFSSTSSFLQLLDFEFIRPSVETVL